VSYKSLSKEQKELLHQLIDLSEQKIPSPADPSENTQQTNPLSEEGDLDLYLQNIQDIPELSSEEDCANLKPSALVNSHLKKVVAIALSYSNSETSTLDLVQKGNNALKEAVKLYKPQKNKAFWDFAKERVEEAIKKSMAEIGLCSKMLSLCSLLLLSLSASQVQANPYSSFSITPEISSVQSGPQIDNNFDPSLWQKPSHVHESDWQEILQAVDQTSQKYNIPQKLILAQIKKESSFRKDAVSSSGATGLMQIKPSTASSECQIHDESQLYNITSNIDCGVSYLSKLEQRFHDIQLALASYNAGPGTVSRTMQGTGTTNINDLKPHLRSETQNYVEKIIAWSQ